MKPILYLVGVKYSLIDENDVLRMFRYSLFLNTFTENIPQIIVQNKYLTYMEGKT